jgi:hypothetical protein
MRRAARAVRRAVSHRLTHYKRRAFASRMGRALGTPLPDRDAGISLTVRDDVTVERAGFCRNALAVAATAIVLDKPVSRRAVEAVVYAALLHYDIEPDEIADTALRWYIREWVGTRPVPPPIRQAASAAWLADHPEVAYAIITDYAAQHVETDPGLRSRSSVVRAVCVDRRHERKSARASRKAVAARARTLGGRDGPKTGEHLVRLAVV